MVIPPVVAGAARLGFVLPDRLCLPSRREQQLRTLDALVEAGCTAFDLAASYQLGGTERLFGRWLASRGLRDRLFLAGKGGHPYPGVRPNRLTAAALSADLEASLGRLGIERFDLWLLHRDFPGAPLEPIVRTLAAAHRAGKLRDWGVSNWTVARIEALQAAARAEGLPQMAASSPGMIHAATRVATVNGAESVRRRLSTIFQRAMPGIAFRARRPYQAPRECDCRC